jgi:glucose dehydrogenase
VASATVWAWRSVQHCTDSTLHFYSSWGCGDASEPPFNENFGAPYSVKLGAFLSPVGLPCQAPPWGYIAGMDLTTGKITYQHVNGTVRDLSPIPLPFQNRHSWHRRTDGHQR